MDILVLFESENKKNINILVEQITKFFMQYGLYDNFKAIMVEVNVEKNINTIEATINDDLYECIDSLVHFFSERRKLDYISEFVYDIEQQTLRSILKKTKSLNFKFFVDTKRFFQLFSFYFTADMKTEFFELNIEYLKQIENNIIHNDKLDVFYICAMIATWIIKNTDYNSEVTAVMNIYLNVMTNNN